MPETVFRYFCYFVTGATDDAADGFLVAIPYVIFFLQLQQGFQAIVPESMVTGNRCAGNIGKGFKECLAGMLGKGPAPSSQVRMRMVGAKHLTNFVIPFTNSGVRPVQQGFRI